MSDLILPPGTHKPTQPRPEEPPTPDQIAQMIVQAKLAAVRQLVEVMKANNPTAFNELLYRLTNSFKNRVILDPSDTATPEQMAQGLMVAVLMSAIGVEGPEPTNDA